MFDFLLHHPRVVKIGDCLHLCQLALLRAVWSLLFVFCFNITVQRWNTKVIKSADDSTIVSMIKDADEAHYWTYMLEKQKKWLQINLVWSTMKLLRSWIILNFLVQLNLGLETSLKTSLCWSGSRYPVVSVSVFVLVSDVWGTGLGSRPQKYQHKMEKTYTTSHVEYWFSW